MKRLFLEFESKEDGEINNRVWKDHIINALYCTVVRKCIRPNNQIEFYVDIDEPNVVSGLNKAFKCPMEFKISESPQIDSPSTYYTAEKGKTNSIEFWGYIFIKDKKKQK